MGGWHDDAAVGRPRVHPGSSPIWRHVVRSASAEAVASQVVCQVVCQALDSAKESDGGGEGEGAGHGRNQYDCGNKVRFQVVLDGYERREDGSRHR